MKPFVALSALLGLAAAEADPWYATPSRHPSPGYPNWPGVVAPGFESTCYGCGVAPHLLGKRDADADPWGYAPYGLYHPYGGVAAHGTGVSYTQRSPQGIGKRDAEADPWGYGPFYHGLYRPYGAVSYTQRSPQGLGKRDAEADPWGYAPFYHGLYRPYGLGVAGHPGAAVSYTQRSPQGLGKRSAPEAETPAKATHPGKATSYVGQTVWGFPLSKREAGEEPEAAAEPEAPSKGYVYIGPTTWGFPAAAKEVEKRDAEAGVSYTHRSPQGAYGYPGFYHGLGYYWG